MLVPDTLGVPLPLALLVAVAVPLPLAVADVLLVALRVDVGDAPAETDAVPLVD